MELQAHHYDSHPTATQHSEPAADEPQLPQRSCNDVHQDVSLINGSSEGPERSADSLNLPPTTMAHAVPTTRSTPSHGVESSDNLGATSQGREQADQPEQADAAAPRLREDADLAGISCGDHGHGVAPDSSVQSERQRASPLLSAPPDVRTESQSADAPEKDEDIFQTPVLRGKHADASGLHHGCTQLPTDSQHAAQQPADAEGPQASGLQDPDSDTVQRPARTMQLDIQGLQGHSDVPRQLYCCCLCPDKELVLTGSASHTDSSFSVHSLASGQLLQQLHGHAAPVLSLAITRDGSHILSGSYDKTIRCAPTLCSVVQDFYTSSGLLCLDLPLLLRRQNAAHAAHQKAAAIVGQHNSIGKTAALLMLKLPVVQHLEFH